MTNSGLTARLPPDFVRTIVKRELQTALELAKQEMRLAQSVQDRVLLSVAHGSLGVTLYLLGELTAARLHLEQSMALYDPQTPFSPPSVRLTRGDYPYLCIADPLAAWLSGTSPEEESGGPRLSRKAISSF